MANITVLALDPQTGDLCFDANGMLMLREDAEAVSYTHLDVYKRQVHGRHVQELRRVSR